MQVRKKRETDGKKLRAGVENSVEKVEVPVENRGFAGKSTRLKRYKKAPEPSEFDGSGAER